MSTVNRTAVPSHQQSDKSPAAPGVTVNRVIDPKYQVPSLEQIKGLVAPADKPQGS